MTKAKTLPSQDYLRQCFNYEPDTGLLVWRTRPIDHYQSAKVWKIITKRCAGLTAGYRNKAGYIAVNLDGSMYLAHRIIVKLVEGEDCEEVDHVDGIRHNNLWGNLRPTSTKNNRRNTRISSRNRSGFKGVHFYKSRNKYTAEIRVEQRTLHLGYFSNAEEAHAAYCKAGMEHYGPFFNPG